MKKEAHKLLPFRGLFSISMFVIKAQTCVKWLPIHLGFAPPMGSLVIRFNLGQIS